MQYSGVAWGDFDNDGDLDVLANGYTGSSRELRIYKNNGNGTMNGTRIEVDGAGGGLTNGRVAWGDFDNDGDLDVLASGFKTSGSTNELRIYKNNGNGTMDAAQIEVDGAAGGLQDGGVAWGDYDNDGDFDLLASGWTEGSTRELRIYKNNGNGTLDAAQIEIDGAGNGLDNGRVAWGDFDTDGDLDVLVSGGTLSSSELRIYKNNGNGTMNATQIEVDGAWGGLGLSCVEWGDYDNDGDLDVLANGFNGSSRELRIYKNNGNGTMNAAQIEVDGAGGGLYLGSVAWGDFDTDGDLDVLASGVTAGNTRELRVYKNNGNGTMDATQIEIDGAGGGLSDGGVAWGDYDNEGDLDVLASGYNGSSRSLRIYKNLNPIPNTAPTSPGTLAGQFSYNQSGVSIASFTWNAGTDSGTGATPENVLTYDLQISTVSNFSILMFPGQWGASPRMGSYLKPPKIFNSNTYYGTVLKSTDPWNAQATANYGLRTDTTYYYRVKTVDSALAESLWSSTGTLNTGVSPSTSTLAAASTGTEGEVVLTWNSAGDDAMAGSLTGNYRVQYATYTATWSTSTTPTDATTVTISTTNIVPGSDQSYVIGSLTGGTPYYFALWTEDEVPHWSGISNISSAVPSGGSDSVSPSTSTLTAAPGATEGEIGLSWSSAGNDGSTGNLTGNYRIQYATFTASWSTSSTPSDATTLTIATTSATPGTTITRTITSLTNATTYYVVLWTQDDANNWSTISNTASALSAGPFDPNQIDVDGPGGGLEYSGVAWGDFDNDGDLDLLGGGYTGGGSNELRIYKNNGNGTMDAAQIEVAGQYAGMRYTSVAWGDYDNDGDLDILTNGFDGAFQLRLYKNNGNGTMNATPIDVDGAGGGVGWGGVAWGDFDNDGDLDIMESGSNLSTYELRIYKNNGNGTMDAAQIDVNGAGGGLDWGSVAWGDYDNDGDLDVLAGGGTASTRELRIYKNNGNGTMNATPLDVDGAGGGFKNTSVGWGDYDNDGDIDALVSGAGIGGRELCIYKNNANGTMDATQVDLDGAGGGLDFSSVAWGDFDNDGDLDVLASGQRSDADYPRELRVYKNNGNGTMNAAQIDVDGAGGGLYLCSVAWGDYDNDGDLDILASGERMGGNCELRIYRNLSATPNTPPAAPGTLNGEFTFSSSGVSIASLTWNAGTDSGTGATPENVLTYDIQISTVSDFSKLMFPGQLGATPRMGSYLKPPKIFNSNTYYGTVLKSTDPWNAQTTANYGLRTDTTYYYRVKTVDSALAESLWSSSGTLNTGVSPSTSTLAAASTGTEGEVLLTWNSAGDDAMAGSLTGNYRVQYATYTATWSTSTTPTDATTVTISTTNIVPGSDQSYVISSLTGGTPYYFALWTEDEVPHWSGISNTTSATPSGSASTVTLAEAVGQPGWIGQGETQRILGTAQAVSDSAAGVTVSSVAVRETGSYTADGNLTNVEVWVSSSGYIDANAIRLEGTAKAFSSDTAVFTQDVTVSTTPLYFIARCDVGGSATEGTFEISLQLYTAAVGVNNPIAFTNATDVVAPPSGSPAGLTATASGNLLQVNLSWSGAAGADSYTIYRATHAGVTTTDFLLGMTDSTTFADDSIPPTQQMYYTLVGSNRAGGTSASNTANATAVDIPALTTSNIYLRAGLPYKTAEGNMAYGAPLNYPSSTFIDNAGNMYIADTSNHRIRFVPKSGGTYFGQAMTANSIYIIAGNGAWGYLADNVAATSTRINSPYGVTVDAGGNVYIADTSNHRIRFVPKSGGTYFGQAMTANYIYTIAGNGTGGYLADNVAATSTRINTPYGASVDAGGNVYIADMSNHRIRFMPKSGGTYFGQAMTANYIYTIAGNGTAGYLADNVAATSTQIYSPYGVSVDAGGNVYIAAYVNKRIRFVPKSGGTYFGQAMTANYIYTIAGNGTAGYLADNVAATSTRINYPYGVSVDAGGNVYIADTDNNRIRFVPKSGGTYFGQAMTANYIYTIAGNGTAGYLADNVAATSTRINSPYGVTVDASGNMYIADRSNIRIRFVPKSGGTYFGQTMTANYIYTIAGNGTGVYLADNLTATSTGNNTPYGVSVDAGGNVYIADSNNNRIRFVPKIGGTYFGQAMAANYIYTIAGNGTAGYLADNVAATSTQIYTPKGVSVDAGGNVYIADYGNHRTRFVPKSGGTYFGQAMTANYIYTIAGNGTAGYLADNVAATSTQMNNPNGVSVDAGGNVYIAEENNHRIRFVPQSGGTYFGQAMTANYIYTIAGNGTAGYLADNVAATSTRINYPRDVSVDAGGNVYIADYLNNRIRFVPQSGGTYFGQAMTANYIYTIAGNGTAGYLADNVAATSTRINNPSRVSVDAGGNMYIADTINHRIRFVPKSGGTYFGQSMTANYIYTICGTGNITYNGENAVATGKDIYTPYGVYAGPDHMVYLTDLNHKIRMIAVEDFIAPSTSTIIALAGVGEATLSWNSAGDDMVNLGNLTGNYRIQYATYTATWSTGSTPTNATTVTISTTNAVPGSAQSYVAGSLTPGNTYYFALFTADEVPNWSDVSNTASAWLDGTPPSTSTLVAVPGSNMGEINLSWASAGDDGMAGNLTGNYRIQYATYTVAWNTSSTPTDATTVTIATTTAVPGSAEATTISSLTGGITYYFVLWSQDESNNWSNISNVPSTYATGDVTAPSTSTLAAVPGSTEGKVNLSWNSAGDDAMSGNLSGNYRIQYATYTAAWSTTITPTDATTVTITATSIVPGSAQATTISSLVGGTTYYFVLWSQDEANNWSDLSNTASAPATGDVAAPSTSTLTAVTGTVDGGIDLTWASAGDDGMTGNLTGAYRIQYATDTVSWSTSSTPTDATTLTLSAAGVAPGAIQSTSVVVGLIQTYYFVIWTQDDASNWSVISGTASATPFLGIRSVTILSGTPLAFGVVNMGTQVVTSTGVVVRNNGTLPCTYIMRASTQTPGTTWSVKDSTPAAPDALVFYGAYDGATAPAESDFGVEDVIGPAYQQCTGTRYTVAGAITGDNVPAGEDRVLWIRLDMPTTTQTTDSQTMKIEITAQPP